MVKRSISKKTRFEIFKRDSFTCQYCGRKAPNVVLEIDHVEPISKGGTDDILNLVTSCKDCNRGKGNTKLSDNSVIEKRRQQLEELQERKEQIEMLLEWQKGLLELDDQLVLEVADYWHNLIKSFGLNELGIRELKKLTNRFSVEEILYAMRTSVDQYLEYEDNKPTEESVNKAWNYVGRICAVEKESKENPYLKDIYYIRGILRNRLYYINENMVIPLLERAIELNVDIEGLKKFARRVRSWTEWRNGMEDYIYEQENNENEE